MLGTAGWSFRFFSAIGHGCVPVWPTAHSIPPFASFLDYTYFTFFMRPIDIKILEQLLYSVPISVSLYPPLSFLPLLTFIPILAKRNWMKCNWLLKLWGKRWFTTFPLPTWIGGVPPIWGFGNFTLWFDPKINQRFDWLCLWRRWIQVRLCLSRETRDTIALIQQGLRCDTAVEYSPTRTWRIGNGWLC